MVHAVANTVDKVAPALNTVVNGADVLQKGAFQTARNLLDLPEPAPATYDDDKEYYYTVAE